MKSARSIATLALPLITAAIVSPTDLLAQAQEQVFVSSMRIGRAGMDTSFRPAMSDRELKHYGEVLALDDAQGALASGLLESYRQTFEEESTKVRERMDEIREEAQATGDFNVFGREMGPVMEEWNRTSEQLAADLFANLKSVLREDQIDRWPVFEREKRRADLLPNSRLGGEDVDLVALVGDLELDEEALERLASLLEQYAVEMDVALQSREAVIPPLQEEMFQKMGDRDAVTRIWEQGTKKRVVVRDVNERFMALLRAELPEDLAQQIERKYLERAFPLAYEVTRAHKLIEAVRTLETLEQGQVDAINEFASQFETQIQSISDRLIEEIRQEEEGLPPFIANMTPPGEGGRRGGQAMQIVIAGGPGGGNEQYDGLLKERFNLSKSTMTQINSVLTPDQRDSMPEIDNEEVANQVFLRGLRFNL